MSAPRVNPGTNKQRTARRRSLEMTGSAPPTLRQGSGDLSLAKLPPPESTKTCRREKQGGDRVRLQPAEKVRYQQQRKDENTNAREAPRKGMDFLTNQGARSKSEVWTSRNVNCRQATPSCRSTKSLMEDGKSLSWSSQRRRNSQATSCPPRPRPTADHRQACDHEQRHCRSGDNC